MNEEIQEDVRTNKYEIIMFDLIEYMIENSIFNTIVSTTSDDGNEFSIVLRTKKLKINNLLNHLNKYQKIKNNDSIIDDDCIICMEKFESNQYKRVLDKCSHTFHKKCIDKWFKKNSGNMTCPICRENYNKKLIII